jgi:hypothetical protein
VSTYYIDFSTGDDSHAGTSEGTAWKTIPGTRKADNSGWESSDWGGGTINSSNKVPAGTIFRIKPGTTHNSSNGGLIQIDTTYYVNATTETPTEFHSYQAWSGASGSVTFDGTGMTMVRNDGHGLFYIVTMGGFTFDGETGVNGFIFRDSPIAAIGAMTSTEQDAIVVKHTTGYNNGTALSGDEAAIGQFRCRYHSDCSFSDMEIDGNGNSGNGILLADSGKKCTGVTITDVVVHDHYGTNDGGMGIKAYNSDIILTNVTAYNNFKGIDLGEDDGDGWDISYKILNSTLYSNTESGIGLSGSGVSRETSNNWYVINCLIYDNGNYGINAYAGLFNIYVVHNVFDNNGWNITVNPDDDTEVDRAFFYNNIFYKPTSTANYFMKYWTDAASDFVLDSDYNSWVQNASEYFCRWSNYQEGPDFSYGADGPGHGAGSNWFDWKGGDTSANSLGHQGCDEHSVGTGASDTTLPPFQNVDGNNYHLIEAYVGVDISGQGWYTAEMGTDRDGVTRSEWSMGAYEYSGGGPPGYPFASDLVMVLS